MDQIVALRVKFHEANPLGAVIDYDYIHDPNNWVQSWDKFEQISDEPLAPKYYSRLNFRECMPSATGAWSNLEMAIVSSNLEGITQSIFRTLNVEVASSPNAEYRARLRQVMMQVIAANENFTDVSAANYSPMISGVYDLFYLNAEVNLLIKTLDGYSKAPLVQDRMKALRYYVSEMLYVYRVNDDQQ